MKLFSIHSGPSCFSAFWVYRIQLAFFFIGCLLFFYGNYTFSQIRSHPEREPKPLRHSFEASLLTSYYHDGYPIVRGTYWGISRYTRVQTGYSLGYSQLLNRNFFLSLRTSHDFQDRYYSGLDTFPIGKVSGRWRRNINLSFGKLFSLKRKIHLGVHGGIQYRWGSEGVVAAIVRGGDHFLIDHWDYNEIGVHIGVRPQIDIYRRLTFFTDLQFSAYPYTDYPGREIAGVFRKPNQLTTTFKMGLAFRPF